MRLLLLCTTLLAALDGCVFDRGGLQQAPDLGGVPDVVSDRGLRPEREAGRPDRARDSLLIDSACGKLGQVCCSGACTGGELSCESGQCVKCGNVGDVCCPTATCVKGQLCVSGKCTPCGALKQPCCTSTPSCEPGGVCQDKDKTCVECGQVDLPCCTDGCGLAFCDTASKTCKACGVPTQPCCYGLVCVGSSCQNNVCIATYCGGKDQFCCLDLALMPHCNPGLVCSILCSCGKVGEPCCLVGAKCEVSLTCNTALNKCQK